MAESFEIRGKVALITGSMFGIGLHTAKSLLKENLKGLILLDIVENDSVLKELKDISNGAKILYRKCDVSNSEDLVEAYNYAWNSFGYIHLAVHSAGIINENDSRKIVCTYVAGVIDGSMWLWNKMRKDAGGEGGTIINIASIAGIINVPILPIYSATKHAIRSFSECLGNSFHFERTNVRVLAICPGLTQTSMTTRPTLRVDGEINEEFAELIGTYPVQKVEAVAKIILEIYEKAPSGTAWVSFKDLPAIQHVHKDEKELLEAYFSK